MHASRLRSLFLEILFAATCASSVSACGSKVEESATDAGACRPLPEEDASSHGCGYAETWYVPIETPEACSDGGLSDVDCYAICGTGDASCSIAGDHFVCSIVGCAVDGRRPGAPLSPPPSGDLGAWFVRMAYFEAASVQAFVDLAHDLRAHGAPPSLLRAIRRAAADERRHASMAAALAARFGGGFVAGPIASTRGRSLLDLARENAREGCGRELLGALVGVHLSQRAHDAAVRDFYAVIARDETRHAAVSLRLHRWLIERLDEAGRQEVESLARDTLASVAAVDGPSSLALPSNRELARYAVGLRRALAA
jgi:hypothetical protein